MDDQEAARWRQWINLLGRIRIGTQKVAGKTISAFTVKSVAERLSTYGNPDGSEVRPGIARIAVDMETTYTTVRNAITVLERLGLLRLVSPGTRKRAAVYQLVIGENLIESGVEIWSPSRHTLEIRKVAEKYRGQSETPRNADPSGVSDKPETLTPQGSAVEPDDLRNADPSGTGNRPNADPSGTETLTPQGSATSHRPRTTTDQPTEEDARTAVTGPRARADPTEETYRRG